jgi:hypothetical protein
VVDKETDNNPDNGAPEGKPAIVVLKAVEDAQLEEGSILVADRDAQLDERQVEGSPE